MLPLSRGKVLCQIEPVNSRVRLCRCAVVLIPTHGVQYLVVGGLGHGHGEAGEAAGQTAERLPRIALLSSVQIQAGVCNYVVCKQDLGNQILEINF